ncbi:MAG: metal ABC transporter solute-binding protein, Zn/Mn family [Galactobacter sp.]
MSHRSAGRRISRLSTRSRILPALAVLTAAGMGLAACGSDSAGAGEDDTLNVVASTDVYGSIAEEIGGDHINVTSVIASASQDPHSYEASPRDKLAFSKADVVVINGGGYDGFAEQLLDSLGNDPVVVKAVDSDHAFLEESGEEDHEEDADEHDHEHHHHGEANEHVWYNVHTISHVSEHVAEDLAKADPDNKADYEANAEAFQGKLEGIETSLNDLDGAAKGKAYLMTEPVPSALLDAAGLTNATPEGLSEAVEEGDEIPAALLNQGLQKIKQGDINLFAYNAQTADDQTQKLRDAAEDADIPVIDFTETLPEDMGYVEWMESNVSAVGAALKK